jgi:hypothetical protein
MESSLLEHPVVRCLLGLDFHLDCASSVLLIIHDAFDHGASPMTTRQADQALGEGADLQKMETAWTTKTFGDVIRHGEYPSQLSTFSPFHAPSQSIFKGIQSHG